MRAGIICSVLMLASSSAYGYQIKQEAAYKDNSGAYRISFDWQLDDSGFRLETKKANESKIFIHNGKIFYICGSLSKAQLGVVKSLKIDDAKLIASLEKGVCQELSTDFTLRFFLSPWDAVTSIDTGAGYASGLGITNPTIEISGKAGSVAGAKCVEFTRGYTLTNKKFAAMSHESDETSCNASAVKWRQGFTRSLGMTLIRKPGGKSLYQAINDDVKKMSGFTLTMTTNIVGKDNFGAGYKKSIDLKTTAFSDKAPNSGSFSLPAKYEIIDPMNLSTLAAKSSVKSSPGSDAGNSVANALKFFILGGNPASAVFKSLADGSDDTEKKK